MVIAIISHQDCELHAAGREHVERPERVSVIQQALKHAPFISDLNFYDAPHATDAQLQRVHSATYVQWLKSIAPKHSTLHIDEDTIMNPHTLNAALYAAGSVPFAVDLVMQGQAQAAFCNVRPPGHHAERETAMGFCFFNNIAVGVAHALAEHQLERIAIVDFDVHHGNGTQDIFQNEKRVLLCSSFEHPFYPGYEPEMDNNHIINVPLSAGTQGQEFREKVQASWFNKIIAFKPQLIFFSAGFDAHVGDPLADIALTDADYVWLTKHIADIAKSHCGGKMISVLEGGYNLTALAQCVPAHVQAMF